MKNPPPPQPDPKKKALQILGPAAAVAAVVLLVGVVVSVGGSPAPTTKKDSPVAPSPAKFEFALDGPEWKPLDDGLRIWDVKEGTGEPCPATAKVNVHYTGWLTTGKKFDSSRDRGQPIEFDLDGVIRGWTLGIPGMKVGGVRRLSIPSALGYGPRGTQGIPGNSDLVFEVEMLGYK